VRSCASEHDQVTRHPRALAPLFLVLLVGTSGCQRTTARAAPEAIRILAGGPVSPGFLTGYQHTLPEFRVSLEQTLGSEFVVSALQDGRAELGLAQADAVYTAYRTSLLTSSGAHTQLRGIAVGESTNVYIIVRRDSPFRKLTDLRGRRIGVFAPGTHAAIYEQMILAAYGLEGTASLQPYRPDEMAAHLEDKSIDAATFGGPGMPQVMVDLNRTIGIRLLPLSSSAVTTLRTRYPFFNSVVVSPQDLPGQDGEVQTLGVDTLLVCRQDLTEERVYQLARGFFEVSREMAKTPGAFPVFDADRAAATPIPLHPGAARYYREREVLQ